MDTAKEGSVKRSSYQEPNANGRLCGIALVPAQGGRGTELGRRSMGSGGVKRWPIETMTKEDFPLCQNCGKRMIPVRDDVQKRVTGYLWRCKCMPEGLVVSIG